MLIITIKLQWSRQCDIGKGKDTQIDRQNGTESTEIEPNKYGQLTFYKGGKPIQWRRDRFFPKNGVGTIEHPPKTREREREEL